jgi:PadR family transcriptional regulator PadR
VDHDDAHDKWQVQLRKGALELVILAALRERPVYGLALLRHLQQLPSTAITEGTLYPLLDRLRRDDLVSATWVQEGDTRPRKYYQLTPKGEHKLAALTRAWQQSVTDINALLTMSVAAEHSATGRGHADT